MRDFKRTGKLFCCYGWSIIMALFLLPILSFGQYLTVVRSSGNGSTVPAGVQMTQFFNISATANLGYQFDRWESVPPDCVIDPLQTNTLVFLINPGTNVVTAYFEEIIPVLTANNVGNGSVTVAGTPDSSGGTFAYNQNVSLVAVPDYGYLFYSWSGDISGTNSTVTNIIMTSDMTISANFIAPPEVNLYIYSRNSDGELVGNPSPSEGLYRYNYGDIVSARVSKEYVFPYGTKRAYENGYIGTGDVPAVGHENTGLFSITNNSTVTFNWRTDYKVTVQAFTSGGLSFITRDSGYAISGESNSTWNASGSTVVLTAIEMGGETFVGWGGDGVPAGAENDKVINVFVNSAKDVFALFDTQPAPISLSASVTGSGSLTINDTLYSSGGYFDYEESVVIEAVPDSGSTFSHWSGDLSGTSISASIVMTHDMTIIANFISRPLLDLIVSSTNNAGIPVGNPSPVHGIHYYNYKDLVSINVDREYIINSGERSYQLGFIGTGSVPKSGNENTGIFHIKDDSFIKFNWRTDYKITAQTITSGGLSFITRDSGWLIEGEPDSAWSTSGTVVALSAHAVGKESFLGWAGGGIPAGTDGDAVIYVTADSAKNIFAIFDMVGGDRDNDGMLDLWEDANGLNDNDPYDANGDIDGDGLSNIGEYRFGTDPWNKDSNGNGIDDGVEVAIHSNPLAPFYGVLINNAGHDQGYSFSWNGSSGSVYHIEESTDLVNSNWSVIDIITVDKTGACGWTNPVVGTGPVYYYRVIRK